ncbi:MAG: hypothetical protein HOY78_45630 [Saccharothrix sp.]|nr:hypothetical protein [Saccharothrix sp.]
MIFLRIVRIALIVLGIGAAAAGVVSIAVDAKVSGGPIAATWTCKSEGTGATAQVNCTTGSATYAGPAGLVDTLSYLGLTIGGVALIGAAVAIGQFDRTRITTAPSPTGPVPAGPGPQGPNPMGPNPMGPPLGSPPPGHGPQPGPGLQPGRGHAGSW